MTTGLDALAAGGVAAAVTAALTPVTMRIARRVGAIDEPRDRGLADRPTPRLGGLAICAGTLIAALIFLPFAGEWKAVIFAALLITVVGAVDDVFDLPPVVKLAGQVAAAWIVANQAAVDNFTLPFVHRVDLSHTVAVVATIVGLVLIMNAVNFTDGVDGLAAGVCAIAAASFAFIAFDIVGRNAGTAHLAGVLSAVVAGGALGFLVWNFYPARVFMGDSGSNLLGLLLGSVAILGSVKTSALVGLIAPLVILAVPFLDTTFVVLKRMKYRRPIHAADANHFHHRFSRIGFSQRRTVAYLYAWTGSLAGAAVALRFVPYTDRHGHFDTGWTIFMAAILLVALAASVYLVYLLEILKLRGRFRRETDEEVEQRLETGEFDAVSQP
ncbi:MAG: UDP-GlcNAc:undecaprenyl-phosphate/decaprenyl-phosphate GlcNAc-phosphate transferase [Solirubrobacteraceae bacterium]|nr:UDP-GlcNAc:undecaprenyl-phosphate/decaprenyl-phosphate GlcNAc-phosphate transferase [Solirubrobacteraceae bacterium]